MRTRIFNAASTLAMAFAAGSAHAQDCEVPIGSVLSLTGSMGAVGIAIGDAAQLAVDHFNEAGGVNDCTVRLLLRDDQGQPSVGVDAAKALAEIDGVQVLLGAIQTGVTMPILTSVAAPGRITQISCCSTAPTFTELAREGGTDGYWFRTIPTVRPQGVVMANLARERGYERTAIIYVNSDYGISLAESFRDAFAALGGTVTDMVAYNQEQASYRAEVTSALQGDPDSIFLIAFPADGATALREWLSLGGSQNILLSNAMRTEEFVDAVGAQFLENAAGIDNAQVEGEAVEAFNQSWVERFGSEAAGPGLHTMYDAAAVALLAMEAADANDGTAVRDMIREVTGEGGEIVYPGPEGFARAKEILEGGGRITYVGATGPISFDSYGDVTGPYLIYGVQDGELVTLDTWSIERVNEAVAELEAAAENDQ